ncbi:MAG: hydrogenase maturation nickel metallochaperone HypA [Candidatus Omnitrophota bacterium]|jgi:Zn finger protein HypA/HybF involved in hydrogenase expression
MHDITFANQVLRALAAKASTLKKGEKISGVNVALSPISHVKPGTLTETYKQLAGQTEFGSVALNIRTLKIVVACTSCGVSFPIDGPVFSCIKCGGTSLDIKENNEFLVESVEIERLGDA